MKQSAILDQKFIECRDKFYALPDDEQRGNFVEHSRQIRELMGKILSVAADEERVPFCALGAVALLIEEIRADATPAERLARCRALRAKIEKLRARIAGLIADGDDTDDLRRAARVIEKLFEASQKPEGQDDDTLDLDFHAGDRAIMEARYEEERARITTEKARRRAERARAERARAQEARERGEQKTPEVALAPTAARER